MNWKVIVAIILVVVLICAGLVIADRFGAARTAARYKAQEAETAQALEDIAEAQRQVVEAETRTNKVLKDAAKHEKDVKALTFRVIELQKQRNEAVLRANAKEAEVATLHAKIAELDIKRKTMPTVDTLPKAVKEINRLGY